MQVKVSFEGCDSPACRAHPVRLQERYFGKKQTARLFHDSSHLYSRPVAWATRGAKSRRPFPRAICPWERTRTQFQQRTGNSRGAAVLIFRGELPQETAKSQGACQVRFHCLDCRWCFCLRKHSSDQEKKLTHSGRAPSSGNRQGINQGTRTRNMAFRFASQGSGLRRKEVLE